MRAWRMVEAQHQISTRKLVDSAGEHEVLEALLERHKPPLPDEREFAGLHYLLATPFRYPPLRWGSRYGPVTERGIWYGATKVHAVLAEVAFYRLLLLEGTTASIPRVSSEHTLFRVQVRAERGLDLGAPSFDAARAELVDPASYAATQRLGSEMRAHGVEAFVFPSARSDGTNVGVLTPRAFVGKQPDPQMQTWHCTAGREQVWFQRRTATEPASVAFDADRFRLDGRLPHPG